METEKMDIQFEHETSEECEMSLQDNENTIDIPEKENKPPRSFLIKLALALTKTTPDKLLINLFLIPS